MHQAEYDLSKENYHLFERIRERSHGRLWPLCRDSDSESDSVVTTFGFHYYQSQYKHLEYLDLQLDISRALVDSNINNISICDEFDLYYKVPSFIMKYDFFRSEVKKYIKYDCVRSKTGSLLTFENLGNSRTFLWANKIEDEIW